MLNNLKEKISVKIQENQIKKQELYEQISNIDSDLFDLNEIMLKLSDRESFFSITPKEAFLLLEKIGYNKADRLEVYLELIRMFELERDQKLIEERNEM